MVLGRSRSGRHINLDNLDREFVEAYQTIVHGKGVRTDEEEFDLVNELIRRSEQGAYPEDGSMHIVSPRAGVDWGSDSAHRAVQSAPERNYGLLAGGLMIGVTLVIALLLLVGGNSGESRSSSTTASATATALTADAMNSISLTPSLSAPQATQTAIAQATAVWGDFGIEVGTDYKQKLPPLYPETLEIAGLPFRVYPSAISNGTWPYQAVERSASWIGGTLINWCFGVPAVEPNIALFAKLEKAQESDRVALLRMSGGLVRRYQLQKPIQVERQQIEVFAQNQPGITIVLLGDQQGSKRWIIYGSE